MQCICNEDENSSRFSVIAAAAAGCTATVAPGAGGTGNTLPTIGTFVVCGSQTGSPVHSNWLQVATGLGRAQIVAVNCTGAAGVSPDGSFWILQGDTGAADRAQLLGYFRCDDSEEGDLDPFVAFKVGGIAPNAANNRVDGTGTTILSAATVQGSTTSNLAWRGWRRRGFGTGDAFRGFMVISQNIGNTMTLADNNANPEMVACSYTSKRLRERVQLISTDNTAKMRKGSPRWLWALQGGTTFDTVDGKTKVLITPSSSSNPSYLVGPYDGVTTPIQA